MNALAFLRTTVAGGYTSTPEWFTGVLGILQAAVAGLVAWGTWRHFRAGARPARDVGVTWASLLCGAVSVGAAYPHNPGALLLTVLCAAWAAVSTRRTRTHGSPGQRTAVMAAWVVALPLSVAFMVLLR